MNNQSDNLNDVIVLQKQEFDLPLILKGEFFEVIQTNDKKVIAVCQMCKHEVKGQVDSTGNFLLHLKVRNNLVKPV